MNRVLWRKELHDQRFFALFGLVLVGLDLLDLTLSQPDHHALGDSFVKLAEGLTWFGGVSAFAIGSGLLARELDEGTIGFLDGLPVSRWRVFVIKLATALGVLLIYPVFHVALHAGLHLAARGSLDHELHAGLLVLKLVVLAVVLLELLLLGMLFGFSKGLAWGLFALCVALIKALAEHAPWVDAVLPSSLVEFRLVGTSARLSPTTLVLHLSLAALLFGLTAWLFGRAGRASRLDGVLKRPLISAGVLLGTGVAVFFALNGIFEDKPGDKRRRSEDKLESTARFTPAPAGHASTGHYRFVYPAHRGEPVAALLEGADDAFARVAELLHVDGGAPIPVDLSGSSTNTEGTALNGTIRMGLQEDALIPVLAHETSHVFASRIAGRTGHDALTGMGVFDEGLARWVERHFDSDGGFTELDRFEAAAVSRRGLVPPAMLTDTDRLYRAQGETLRYVLGDTLVAALVKRYGPQAPRRVLETIGGRDFPRGLKGHELWTAAFQVAGLDLPLVLDDYARQLKVWEADHAKSIDELPRMRGVAWKTKGFGGVQVLASRDWPKGWYPAVRFRPTLDSPLSDYRYEWPKLAEIAWEPITAVTGDEICFQVGLGAKGVTLYEPWQCLPLDDAAELEK